MTNRTLSAATRRAANTRAGGSEWYCGFTYTPVEGLGPQVGLHRRDPSSVIEHDGLYYVYYTRSAGPFFGDVQTEQGDWKLFPWDHADVWFATSRDGIVWDEQGPAVARGPAGSYDARTCCTPDVLAHDDRFYLVYQTQADEGSYASAHSEKVGMAVADHPAGPFDKISGNILEPMESGEWFAGSENYNKGWFAGATHDPSLFFYNGKFHLYYKCCYVTDEADWKNRHKSCGPDTRWGVATADRPEGPYTHSPFNPITNSGHETLLWHYNGGIACLLNRDGPEQDTIQWAPDGINFEIMAHVSRTPMAGGAFRSACTDTHPLEGLRWGLCHVDERGSTWNHIVRFDVDKRLSYKIGFGYPAANTDCIF